MRRTCTLVPIWLLLLAASGWAGEPWKRKPPENWDKHDVDQILRNSPWAQVVTVPYSPFGFTSDQPETGKGTQVGKVIRDPGKDPLDVGSADARTWSPDGVFVLRWESSRTIRLALARKAMLQGDRAQASSGAEIEPEDYELVMVTESTVRLPDSNAEGVASNTYLKGKLSGLEIHPRRIEFRRNPDTDRVVAVEFYFGRRTSDGRPIAWTNEEVIEFFCQVGPRTFHAKFHPRQMTSRDGPDL